MHKYGECSTKQKNVHDKKFSDNKHVRGKM